MEAEIKFAVVVLLIGLIIFFYGVFKKEVIFVVIGIGLLILNEIWRARYILEGRLIDIVSLKEGE